METKKTDMAPLGVMSVCKVRRYSMRLWGGLDTWRNSRHYSTTVIVILA